MPRMPEIVQPAYKVVETMWECIQICDGRSSKRLDDLDGQIREAVSEFEDVLDSHISNQLLSQSEGHHLLCFIDLQDLRQDVDSFVESMRKLVKMYCEELLKVPHLPEEEEDDDDNAAISLRTDFAGKKSKVVGFSDQLCTTRDHALLTDPTSDQPMILLSGMAGIGKTTFAAELFEDPLVVAYFDCRAWVKVGRKYQLNKVLEGVLAQVDPDKYKMLMKGDQIIGEYLKERLKDKKCLIVLDDVWESRVCVRLRHVLPDNHHAEIRILLTSRLNRLAYCNYGEDFDSEDEIICSDTNALSELRVTIPLLNKEQSWDLLREKVFGEDSCPPQLEKDGKKIAENCEGLPLLIVTVANLLSKAETSLEYWNEAARKQNSVFKDAYDEITKVLYPSYEFLPQRLKLCFLYLGVFPQSYEIPLSKLINMLTVEGFLEPNKEETLEECALGCLIDLYFHNVAIFHERITNFGSLYSNIKSCHLHSTFWYLCSVIAKNKFFHVLNRVAEGLEDGVKSQRRLSIHNNFLFAIKDMHNKMEDECASTARSLLCFGPYHQYQVPICFGLRLLRVIDALKIRFYEFPVEVLKLVMLKYLALTYNGALPTSISKLWNLQFLIIHRHMSIKTCGAPSYVPLEIWDMHELKHLEIMGSSLLIPNCDASLENLLTLLGVSALTFDPEILKRISNLKKLGIQIELEPDDDGKPFRCLNQISHLSRLESFKCIVVNPELRSEVVVPPTPMFTSSLKKLSLSGLGYPWEYMSIIGSLPNLEMLKLRCHAFRGPKWEIEENQFLKLLFLLIEDTDLVQWKIGRGSFNNLGGLHIKHCYKLEELHWEPDYELNEVKVIDCNPAAVRILKNIKTNGDSDSLAPHEVKVVDCAPAGAIRKLKKK